MKKVITIIVSVLMIMTLAVSFAACNKDTGNDGNNGENTDVTPSALDKTVSEAELQNIVGDGKLYATTIGQADLAVVNNLIVKAGVAAADYTSNNMLTADQVEDGSTVFIVVGASGKGLGGAGTDAAAELVRANAFQAKADKINIVCVHVGGANRRGDTSDPTIRVIAGCSKVILVVEEGNSDDLFTGIANDNSIPLYEYSKSAKMLDSFKYLLGK
ncbi:MAG: DUF6305 family protein [Eubacteriales bacterium]|nr:DUF6305 family protein [Christensenellaceae bacterium]MDY2750993.1 DUF6305 family protein [Eubacteriales bacterium]